MKQKKWQVWLLGVLIPLAVGLGLRAYFIHGSYQKALSLQQQAQHHLSDGHRAEALKCLKQAADAYPHLLELYQDRADIYIVQGDWKEALACWDTALCYAEGNPNQGLCRRQRALILAQLGRMSEARDDARLAVSLNPQDGNAKGLLKALEKGPQ